MWRQKHILIHKMLPNGINIDLLRLAWFEMTVDGVATHLFSSKERVLDTAVNKEGHADSLLGHFNSYYF